MPEKFELPYRLWGPRIDHEDLPDLFAPQEIQRLFPTPAGIDNLQVRSVETFYVPGRGEFTAETKGTMRIARSQPTTDDWATCEVELNVLDLKLRGECPTLGPLVVRLNPEYLSAGQVLHLGESKDREAPADSKIALSAVFDLPGMGFVSTGRRRAGLFNKEPIVLINQGVTALPPIGDRSGSGLVFKLPLYHQADPNGRPFTYLTRLEYTIGDYVSREEAEELRKL